MLDALRMPRFKSALVRVCGVLAVLATSFFSVSALAVPVINIPLPNPDRQNADGTPGPTRELGRNSNGISFSDCEKDIDLVFSLTVTGLPTSDTLQVWAGVGDCIDKANRNSTTGTCQPVTDGVPMRNATIPVRIRARDLAAINGQLSPAGSGGVATFVTAVDDSSCKLQQSPAGRTMSLVFLAFPPGSPDAEAYYVYKTTPQLAIVVDTLGPQPPTGGSIGVGDTLLTVKWTPSGDVTDTYGYRVFCDPPRGKPPGGGSHPEGGTTSPAPTCTAAPQPPAPVVDSGVDTGAADGAIDDASASDAANAADAADTGQPAVDSGTPAVDSGLVCTTPDAGTAKCGTDILQNGVNGSSIPGDYLCADIGDKSATETVVTGLTDDVVYTFAVSAQDASQNAGPTVIIDCKAPAKINDFFDIYRSSGGLAGGGFCALDSPGTPFGTSVFGIGVIGIAAALVRRRRTK